MAQFHGQGHKNTLWSYEDLFMQQTFDKSFPTYLTNIFQFSNLQIEYFSWFSAKKLPLYEGSPI